MAVSEVLAGHRLLLVPHWAALAAIAVVLAACGTTASPAVTPLLSGGLGSAPATAAGSPPASAPASSAVGSNGSGTPSIDTSLLEYVPAKLNGIDRQNDADADKSIQGDPSLGQISAAYTTAFYSDPASGDTAFAIVSRLRGGSIPSDVLRDWRETYGSGTCSNAGGVVGQAQTTIGTRTVDITRCVEAQQVYYVLLPDRGVLLTITSSGDSQLGKQLVEQLPE